MKTSFSKLVLLAGVMLAGLLLPGNALAQMNPFPITNNLNCAVTVNFQMTKQGSCLTCQSGTGIIIPPTSSINVGLAGCLPLPLCNIIVTVTQVGGTAVSPPLSVSYGNTGSGNGGPCAPSFNLTLSSSAGAVIN